MHHAGVARTLYLLRHLKSSWDDLKKNYDACVLAVGLTEPNSARADGEDTPGVLFGLPFLRDIGMGTSKVTLGARVPP